MHIESMFFCCPIYNSLKILAGSFRYFEEQNVEIPAALQQRCQELQDQGHSLILLAEQSDTLNLLGVVALADEIREDLGSANEIFAETKVEVA